MRREHSRKKEPTDGRERIDLARIQAPHPPSCFLSLDVVKQKASQNWKSRATVPVVPEKRRIISLRRDVWGVPLGPTLSPCETAVQQRAINQTFPSFILSPQCLHLINFKTKKKNVLCKKLIFIFQILLINNNSWTFLMVQWIRICLSMQ